MRQWMAGRPAAPTSTAGTVAWLVDHYTSDEDSPYRALRPKSRMAYDDSLKIIRATVGQRRIDTVTGKDVRRWFKE